MKRLLLILPLALLLACCACDAPGSNPARCRQYVITQMKTPDVTPIPDRQFSFIVRDTEGNIYYVECMSSDLKITASTLIFAKR